MARDVQDSSREVRVQLRRTLWLVLVALSACAGGVDDTSPRAERQLQDATARAPSLEVGMTEWGTDHALLDEAPAPGVLFSVWTRIPSPGTAYPWSRGNMDVWVLRGDTWHLRCLVGNSSANRADQARYSANTMLFVDPGERWAGDFSFYESDFTLRERPVRDWVWAAWHVVVDHDSFAIRQWLKFGPTGPVFAAGTSDVTFDQVRRSLREHGYPTDFRPSPPSSMQVGKDSGFITRARVERRTSVPRLAELETIARGQAAPSRAWAEYPLIWQSGRANLSDASGHGRHLSIAPGGTIESGPTGPAL
jgi:hypothetical protein